ncbi:MAG TPA: hypothetical protein VNW99_09870 [Cytophagaceae bacterium]|nr:hypothetical protein [Cytophagaceae bacterium]
MLNLIETDYNETFLNGCFEGKIVDSIYFGVWSNPDASINIPFEFKVEEFNKVDNRTIEFWGSESGSRMLIDSLIIKENNGNIFQKIDLTKYNGDDTLNKAFIDSIKANYDKDFLDVGAEQWEISIGGEDMNFDRLNDFRIIAGTGANGCSSYICFIYNSATKSYQRNHELEELGTQLSFSQEDSTVSTWNKSGPCNYYNSTFKYRDGHYFPWEQSSFCCGISTHRIYAVKNGKSVLISEKIERDEEFIKENELE